MTSIKLMLSDFKEEFLDQVDNLKYSFVDLKTKNTLIKTMAVALSALALTASIFIVATTGMPLAAAAAGVFSILLIGSVIWTTHVDDEDAERHYYGHSMNPFSSLGTRQPMREPIVIDPNETLIPAPSSGVKVGLPNTGNTCWLNASLQFIANNSYFDALFSSNVPEHVVPLQATLKHVINELRSGEEGVISPQLYYQLQREINRLMPQFRFLSRQEDAAEFLVQLTERLQLEDHLPANQRTMIAHTRLGNKQTLLHLIDQQLWLYVGLHPGESEAKIDIENRISEVGQRDLDGGPFLAYDRLVSAPDNLLLRMNRFSGGANGTRKINATIATAADGTMTFPIYESTVTRTGLRRISLKKNALYRIAGTINHLGSMAWSGHYVSYQRNSDGSYRQYNDSHLSSGMNGPETSGYIVLLEKVREEELRAAPASV